MKAFEGRLCRRLLLEKRENWGTRRFARGKKSKRVRSGLPAPVLIHRYFFAVESVLNDAAVVRIPSSYGVPENPNDLANFDESNKYGESLW